MKQADLRDMFKKAFKSVCTSTVVICPDTLSPTPATSSGVKTPENTEEDPDDPEPTDPTELSKWNTPVITCPVKVYGQQQKLTCKNLGQ
jgi:hypothetical protein